MVHKCIVSKYHFGKHGEDLQKFVMDFFIGRWAHKASLVSSLLSRFLLSNHSYTSCSTLFSRFVYPKSPGVLVSFTLHSMSAILTSIYLERHCIIVLSQHVHRLGYRAKGSSALHHLTISLQGEKLDSSLFDL